MEDVDEIKRKLKDLTPSSNLSGKSSSQWHRELEDQSLKNDKSSVIRNRSVSTQTSLKEPIDSVTSVLRDVLSEFTTSSLDRLKWSVNISLQWICSQLQSADNYRVIELMHKSSGDMLKMTIETLTIIPRRDLVKQLENSNPLKEYATEFVLEALQKLNKEERNKFISILEEELSKVWKQRLDEADLSQVIELMETMFSQDPSVWTAALAEKVLSTQTEGSTFLIDELSQVEFKTLKSYLKPFLPHISESELAKCGHKNFNDLMKTNSFRNSVQMIEKVLKRMERPDLVNKLFIHSSRAEPGFRIKSEKLLWTEEELLETLTDMSEWEWWNFKRRFAQLKNVTDKCFTNKREMQMNRNMFVSWIINKYGLNAIDLVADVLVEMGLNDRAKFLQSRTFTKEFEMMAYDSTQRDLLETVHYLSDRELRHFEWFVQFTCLHWGISWLRLESERQNQEFEIISTECCPLTVKEAYTAMIKAVSVKHSSDNRSLIKMTLDTFLNMNRSDLAKQLWSVTTGKRMLEISPALETKIQQVMADVNGLMETLGRLSLKELSDLKHSLSSGAFSAAPWYRLCHYEVSQLVFYIVQTFGQKSIDVTENLLETIGRTDLKQILHTGLYELSEDPWWHNLIHKVATMATIHKVFGQTLLGLRDEDLKIFKKQFVLMTIFREWNIFMDMRLLAITKAEQTGTLLLHTFGWIALWTAYWVLMDMKRSDLAKDLQQTISFPTRFRPLEKVADVKDLRERLCQLITGLKGKDFDEFQSILQSKLDPVWTGDMAADPDAMVDLIFERRGERSMDIITDVLEKMDRNDLIWTYFGQYTHKITPTEESTDLTCRIQDILKELTDSKETQTFTKHLQKSCESNLPRSLVQSYLRVFPRLSDLVDLLVTIYGESTSFDIIQTAFIEMGKLVQAPKSSAISVALKASTENMEVDSGTCEMQIWAKMDPKVEESERQFTYRLHSDAGCYECSVSGLRWRCKDSVTFLYKFVSWEKHMDRMKAMKYMPAGPLIDISVKSGKLDEVYLPHWICIESPQTLQKMAVLHIDDCGDTVEKVTNASTAHVRLLEPIFSPRAVLIKLGFLVKICCSILIYKTNKAFLTLHVYLIPRDPELKESIHKIEQRDGCSIIRKPDPDRSLKIRDLFVLKANPQTVTINPKELTLRHDISPNFFEVYTKNPDFDFELLLSQNNDSTPVWTCGIRQDDYALRQTASVIPWPHGAAFVNRFERDLIERVSNVSQILDELKGSKVISDEVYNRIRKLPTSQDKMREIFSGPLRSSGDRGKNVFCEILKRKEPYLFEELEMSFF